MVFSLFIVFFTLTLSSCVTGPEQAKKSPLNALNAEHYEPTGVAVYGMNLTPKRKVVATQISGTVYEDKGDLYQPAVRFVKFGVYENNQLVSEFVTDEKGAFSVSVNLGEKHFEIRVKNKRFSGQKKFYTESYKLEQIKMIITSAAKS